jgi:hypothetical protein
MPGALDAAARGLVQRAALRREDLGIREQQVLAFHAGAARARADQQSVVAVLERGVGVVACDDAVERRERAIGQFHDDAAERGQRRRDLEQVEVHGLVAAEHLAGGDAEGERVADVARGAGDGDGDGFFHSAIPGFRGARDGRRGSPIVAVIDGAPRWRRIR